MRFAYIDSQGKRVGIPSVEALQLRIELGAILPSTMFFDATLDRWSPASEHDVFRTLQKVKTEQEESLFVAPPTGLEPDDVLLPLVDADSLFADAFQETELAPGTELPAWEEAPPGHHPPAPRPLEGLEVGGFTLSPMVDQVAADSDGFERWGSLAASDGGESTLGTFEIQTNTFSDGELTAAPPLPEPVTANGEHGSSELATADSGRGSDLDQPTIGEADAGPPGWADEDAGPHAPGAAAHRTAAQGGAAQRTTAPGAAATRTAAPPVPRYEVSFAPEPGAVADAPPRPAGQSRPVAYPVPQSDARPEVRARPRSAPRSVAVPQSKPNPVGLVAALVLLAVVGGGGWFAWSMMSGRDAVVPTRTYAPVAIPPIPAEFVPIFRELSSGALLDMVGRMAALEKDAQLPDGPPTDWLAGQYLANASRYPEVASYWNALSAHLMSLREREPALFREAFQGRLSTAAVETVAHDDLVARAAAGFQASLPERDRAYDQLSAVIVAALELHQFLLSNEDDIDFEPVAGGTVMEARPRSENVGDEMWRRVDAITAALESMDALSEQVTTRHLFSLALDGVVSASVR